MFGGEGRKSRKETSMGGCLSHAPYWGLGPQPRHVPCDWESNQQPLASQALNPLRHISQGQSF